MVDFKKISAEVYGGNKHLSFHRNQTFFEIRYQRHYSAFRRLLATNVGVPRSLSLVPRAPDPNLLHKKDDTDLAV